MRIGIDCYPMQAPETSQRGIGKFTFGFIKAMVMAYPGDEFVLYKRNVSSLIDVESEIAGVEPLDAFALSNPNVTIILYDEIAKDKQKSLDAIFNENQHLDWFIVTSPHQSLISHRSGAQRIASIIYDMIPLKFPEIYLDPPELEIYKERFNKYVITSKKYDRLLAISQSTVDDSVNIAGFDRDKFTLIHCGVDSRFKPRGQSWSYPQWIKEVTNDNPYVLHVGGMDERKGGYKLLDAWHILPSRIKTRFNLLYAYETDSFHSFQMNKHSNIQGLNIKFHMLGYVSDNKLVELYQNARVMCLPSGYEGFGLPLLESMACATPVIAGNNSSQIFVVGDGGILVDSSKPEQMAAYLEQLLDHADLRERFARKAYSQATRPEFTWSHVAKLTHEALETTKPRSKSTTKTNPNKQKLAYFGLIPPTLSGVTPVSLRLAEALTDHYSVTYYHDAEVTPDIGDVVYPFVDILPVTKYDGCPRIMFQMGNSEYHEWMLKLVYRRGGVVTLHDARLEGLFNWLDMSGKLPYRDFTTSWPVDSVTAYHDFTTWPGLINGMVMSNCRLIVHSNTAAKIITDNTDCNAVTVIPPGLDINIIGKDVISKMRSDMGWTTKTHDSREAVYVGTGGFIDPSKMPTTLLSAYVVARRKLIESHNKRLVLVFIGKEIDSGSTRRIVNEMAIPDVLWTGIVPNGRFVDTIACLDVCVQLRQEPTNGETSGALIDAIRSGVPCIVSDVGSFSEFPDFVSKIANTSSSSINIARLIVDLAVDDVRRNIIANQGIQWAKEYRNWTNIANQYMNIIESPYAKVNV